MTIETAKPNKGVRFFYIKSDSGGEYVVAHVRRPGLRRWTCSCPDYVFRRQFRQRCGRYCKHVNAVRESLRIANSATLHTHDGEGRAIDGGALTTQQCCERGVALYDGEA